MSTKPLTPAEQAAKTVADKADKADKAKADKAKADKAKEAADKMNNYKKGIKGVVDNVFKNSIDENSIAKSRKNGELEVDGKFPRTATFNRIIQRLTSKPASKEKDIVKQALMHSLQKKIREVHDTVAFD
jgi:peptidoglycan hydrolase-like protein with peptidoglycan-binding domain